MKSILFKIDRANEKANDFNFKKVVRIAFDLG